MANETVSGVRTFSAGTLDELEDKINTFLRGDGTVEDPAKELTQPIAFSTDGTDFFTILVFKKRGD